MDARPSGAPSSLTRHRARHSERTELCLADRPAHVDTGGMHLQEPIYLKSCDECGRPALTYDDQGNALCIEHASVFIPAVSVASNEQRQTPSSA